MAQVNKSKNLNIIRRLAYTLLVASLSLGSAQASMVTYTLDNIFLNSTQQMTGTFVWTYDDGDFENGTGLFSELFIPLTSHTLADLNITFDIKSSIEFTLIDNLDSDGVDITLVFVSALAPTQSTLLDLGFGKSKWSLGGTGSNNSLVSGGISPVPVPAALWLFGAGLAGLAGVARRRKT